MEEKYGIDAETPTSKTAFKRALEKGVESGELILPNGISGKIKMASKAASKKLYAEQEQSESEEESSGQENQKQKKGKASSSNSKSSASSGKSTAKAKPGQEKELILLHYDGPGSTCVILCVFPSQAITSCKAPRTRLLLRSPSNKSSKSVLGRTDRGPPCSATPTSLIGPQPATTTLPLLLTRNTPGFDSGDDSKFFIATRSSLPYPLCQAPLLP
ncbi:hypothetical protein V8E36_002130 [Tilletia maclaganii]